MKYILRILVLAFFSVLAVYLFLGGITGSGGYGESLLFSNATFDLKKDKTTKNSKITLRVLKENCGSCHRSTLSTAKPKALEIFDLDSKAWYPSVSKKHLQGISRRIKKTSGLSDLDRTATLDFIACIRSSRSSNSKTVC